MDAAMNRDAYSPASFNSSVLLPVFFGLQSLGGVEDRETEQEDADWNWDRGVTTHG
jgi:hypothetical protein